MTELETLITQSLPRFADENPLYYKPKTLADWENTWDFGEYDANIYNHGLHQYPARFIPQLVRKIVRTFADENSNVLDIFSGSGTTLLECKYLGIKNAYGIELNPFAVFMTKAKLQDVGEFSVSSALNEIQKSFFDETYNFSLVGFKNIEFWYSENARRDLSKLFDIISKLGDEKAKCFYLLVFCEISRKTSFLDHGGFKMYRSRTKINNHFEPDVWAEFYRTAQRNISLLKANNALVKDDGAKQTLVLGDSRIIHPKIPAHSIDLILTSPPYGDSKTTVAYGQYSRLPWQWLSQKDDIIQLDSNLLGGSTKNLDRAVLNLSAKLKERSEYEEDSTWITYTPERKFYYPSQITPFKTSGKISGTLIKIPEDAKSASSIEKPQIARPDELKSEEQKQKEEKTKNNELLDEYSSLEEIKDMLEKKRNMKL